MKTFLIATAALTLMGGAAFAQDQMTAPAGGSTAAAPAQDAPNAAGSTSSTGAAQDPNMGGSQMNTGTPPASDSSAAPASGAMSSGSTGGSTGGATGADAGAGSMASSAPAAGTPDSYPVCSSKHEDHCMNRSQATRTAKASTHHKKMDNTQPAGM